MPPITLRILALIFAGSLAQLSPAHACKSWLRVSYVEQTPDYFLIEHGTEKGYQLRTLQIDLRTTAAQVEVDSSFGAPRNNKTDRVIVEAVSGFKSGSQIGVLRFKRFLPGEKYILPIDLDDGIAFGYRDYDHLDEGEMKGGEVIAELVGPDNEKLTVTGIFNEEGVADLLGGTCV